MMAVVLPFKAPSPAGDPDQVTNALVLIEDALDALADADLNLGTEIRTCGDINRARAAGRIQAAIWAAQEHLQPHLPQDGAA